MKIRYIAAVCQVTAIMLLAIACSPGTLEQNPTPALDQPALDQRPLDTPRQTSPPISQEHLPLPTEYQPYADVEFPTPTPPAWLRNQARAAGPSTAGTRPARGRTSSTYRQATEAEKLLISLSITDLQDKSTVPYNRDSWNYGTDHDQDCQYTRHEVLVSETQQDPQFQSERRCKVISGLWSDPWTGQTYNDPTQVHIDHHVPLKNAHDSGGHAWSQTIKQAYANDLELPAALNTVSVETNLQKGAQAPDTWRPASEAFHCQYAEEWIAVKTKWHLSVTPTEKQALHTMLQKCP